MHVRDNETKCFSLDACEFAKKVMSSLMGDIQQITLTCKHIMFSTYSWFLIVIFHKTRVPIEASNIIKTFIIYEQTLFSGYVTDEEIERREQKLRRALRNDKKFRVRDGVSVEVAQVHQQSQMAKFFKIQS